MKTIKLCWLAVLALVPLCAAAQDKPVFLSWQAPADETPAADANSPFWNKITGVVIDKSVLGPEMPQFRAEVRSRWTGSNVYFLFIGHYEKLTLRPNPVFTNETYGLWNNDCFEVYLGADFEHINRYREFQISPRGEYLDLDIDSTRPRPGYNGEQNWNSGWTVKGVADETNKIWYGEMKIPITAVDTRPPKPGNEMRINLYRQDGAGTNRDFLAWQPPGIWNPHHPEKFGLLRLVDADGKAPTPASQPAH
jgi:Carbohydrate family 9 binding domain-like